MDPLGTVLSDCLPFAAAADAPSRLVQKQGHVTPKKWQSNGHFRIFVSIFLINVLVGYPIIFFDY